MIQKTWNDERIYKFCKKHKFSLFFNTHRETEQLPSYEITRYKDRTHPDIKKILDWCEDNCVFQYVMCQWHLGYENNIFFKFHDKEDYKNFYRWYDKTFMPKIEVEVK